MTDDEFEVAVRNLAATSGLSLYQIGEALDRVSAACDDIHGSGGDANDLANR